MHQECWERFPRHRGLAIPPCISSRVWRTFRGACWDRLLTISFEASGGDTSPAFPVHAQPAILPIWWEALKNFTKSFTMDPWSADVSPISHKLLPYMGDVLPVTVTYGAEI